MNKVITIPKELSRQGELVIIPRSDYEEFLRFKKVIPLIRLDPSERKAMQEGRKEIQQGEYLTIQGLKDELGS